MRRLLVAACLSVLLLLVGCDNFGTTGTSDPSYRDPYRDVNSCMKDKGCSQRFTEYLDCTARYETGC